MSIARRGGGTQECDRSVVNSMEAKLKEKQAMALVSGLQADIDALQAQVPSAIKCTYKI